MNNIQLSALFLAASTLAACSKPADSAPPTTPPAAAATVAPATAAAVPDAVLPRSKAAEGAKEYFIGIKDGDTVTSPFKIAFGVDGMKVVPAGTIEPGTGHHHLIIDSDLPPQDVPLPMNDHVRHFGKGQLDTELTLPAGTHTLQLEFADATHLPFDPPLVSDKITITVN